MDSEPGAGPFVPDTRSLDLLAAAAAGCRGCSLYRDATQTVFGAGPRAARLILVGEQPGDHEDRKGEPFVGPAGRVLNECLDAAGIGRDDVYLTNAVKHFKHEDRGSRRLHKRPTTGEVVACHPWLDAELRAIEGEVLVALGATAARSILGRSSSIAASRDREFAVDHRRVLVTYHPSAVLRADDRATELRAAIVEDLRRARAWVRAVDR